jgi:hypothetical protein
MTESLPTGGPALTGPAIDAPARAAAATNKHPFMSSSYFGKRAEAWLEQGRGGDGGELIFS